MALVGSRKVLSVTPTERVHMNIYVALSGMKNALQTIGVASGNYARKLPLHLQALLISLLSGRNSVSPKSKFNLLMFSDKLIML